MQRCAGADRGREKKGSGQGSHMHWAALFSTHPAPLVSHPRTGLLPA